jgi:hypothetical protein
MRTSENSVLAKFREHGTGELRRTPLPRTRVNKGKEEGRGALCPDPAKAVYGSQTAVVVTFLHLPGVPLAVHTNSVPAESM